MGRGRRRSEALPPGHGCVEATSTSAEVKAEAAGIGAFGLQEAPVFYPSEEEFQHPLRYIAQIRSQAEPYGICRIVPPSSWNPPLGFDTVKFTFPTKLQAIHQLQERPAACDAETFKLEYARFLRRQGEVMASWPLWNGEELDLCKIYNSVKRHGGYEKVSSERKWVEVVRLVQSDDSGIPTVRASSEGLAVKELNEELLCQIYETHLKTFELYQAKVGSGKRWRVARKKEEPANKQIAKPKRGRRRQSPVDDDLNEYLRPNKSDCDVKTDIQFADVGSETKEILAGQGKRPARGRPRKVSVSEEVGNARKKRESSDLDALSEVGKTIGDVDGDVSTNFGSLRKRRKLEKTGIAEVRGRNDQMCEQCHSGAHAHLMLLCDRCDRGWHLYCLSPPLSTVPVGNWYCLDCIGSESESFGFGQGQEYNFDSFRRMADRFKRKWFGMRPSTYIDVEKEFWRVVERGTGPVEVLYGSDLDTGKYGSGFPRPSDPVPSWSNAEAWEACARSPWNVNNFPKLDGSVLRLVHDNIPGVMVPWLYIGMLFSSFCWHYEDHCFYSVNYLHCGEPKSWYSVPGHAWEAFEKVMRKAFPDLFEAQPDLLFQLVTMLNPSVLRDSGVPVCTTVQEARNFVITFPRSYHGGFNHGFNCAEAVNFAPTDWLPFGGFGVERYRHFHKAAVLSHDELLCVVAKNDSSCGKSPWLQKELVRVITKERQQRELLWSFGMVKSSRMAARKCPDHIGAEEDEECIICHYYLHLSSVVCRCRPGKAVCLQHARQLCECRMDQQCLQYRFSLAELDDLVATEERAPVDSRLGDIAAGSGNGRRARRGHSEATSMASPITKKVKGRLYRHFELAQAWLCQARAAGRSHSRSPVLEELLAQSEQFLWGGHELDQVRIMVEQLKEAHKWVQDVAACAALVERHSMASTGRVVKVPLATVQQLVAVEPVPWVEPHLIKLKSLLEPACSLQQKIIDALASSSSLEVKCLQSLQHEAGHLPIELPELKQLKDIITTAQGWIERVRKLMPTCAKVLRNRLFTDFADLQQFKALQLEGLRIPVMISEKALLEDVIALVEAWQQRASVLLTSASFQELDQALKDSDILPVRLPEVLLVEERLKSVRSWVQDARAALVRAKEQIEYAETTKVLEDLVESGRALRVTGISEMDAVLMELERVRWMLSSSELLKGKPTLEALKSLTLDAERLQIGERSLVCEIRRILADALAWESQAEECLRCGGSYKHFINLVTVAEKLTVSLPSLSLVVQAVINADSWLNLAKPFLKRDDQQSSVLQLAKLEELVADSKKLLVTMDEVISLSDALVAARAWLTEARSLKKMVVAGQCLEGLEGPRFVANRNLQRRLDLDQEKLSKTVASGVALGLEIPELLELQNLLNSTAWTLKAFALAEGRPTITEVERHLSESDNLVVMIPLENFLGKILQDAKSWLQAAVQVLPGVGIKGSCTEQRLEQLITNSQMLAVSVVSEVENLKEVLSSHRAWKKKVQEALAGVSCLTWRDLSELQVAGERNLVWNDEESQLNQEVVNVGSWVLQCFESILSQPSNSCDTLEEILCNMLGSVDYGIELVGSSGVETLCVCKRAIEGADLDVFACDSCQASYHAPCVGVTSAQTRGQKYSLCPFCTSLASGVWGVKEDLFSKIRLTSRPKLVTLLELQRSALYHKCRLKERGHLDSLVQRAQLWQTKLQVVVERALVCETEEEVVSDETLVGVLKAVEAVEVEAVDPAVLKNAVATSAWRNRSRRLLGGTSKPLLRSINRLLKEGQGLAVSEQDIFLKELKERESRASQWAARAKQVVSDHGRMPLPDVHEMLAEGEMLLVSLPKEISALKSRSVLYCLCQKPYDEDRAMIACDRCGEWYHFSCVNLPDPPARGEVAKDMRRQKSEHPEDFICRKCLESEHEKDSQNTAEAMNSRTPHSNEAVPSGMENSMKSVGRGSSGPFQGLVRGKRSNRYNGRARGEGPQRWNSPLFQSGKLFWHTQRRRKQIDQQREETVSASGRPCRRTAGRHSGFESFVLLMRSR